MPADRLTNPPRIPPRPAARSEHEFKTLSPEMQAQAIFDFQMFWQGSAPSASGVSGVSFAPIIVNAPSVAFESTEGSGVNCQQIEADAFADELREIRRIKNQGL